MNITVHADQNNKKTILSLLEDRGFSLPCNCHGRHLCSGSPYPFDCSLIPKAPITIDLPDPEKFTQDSISGIALEDSPHTEGIGDLLLIDLGTTTVALALLHKASGQLRKTCTFPNPQLPFGADVVSRIHAACSGKAAALKHTMKTSLNREIHALCERNRQISDQITSCYIGGNTTMIHLLMGYDCTPLSVSPFRPSAQPPAPFFYHNCHVTILPWFSAFIGGDITAGLLACGHTDAADPSLFLDLGTNGEMVLTHQGKRYAAAVSAGPAFEGGGLSCGCPAIPGAIKGIRLRHIHPALETIENRIPVGLCGSGAICLCAELLRKGFVTEDGILTDKFPEKGIFLSATQQGNALFFTAEDFRNMQLAIAAVAAGIDTLAYTAGIRPEEIRRLDLGGGFGFHLTIEDCSLLHLFSSVPPECIHVLGNTCLRGLRICALSSPPVPVSAEIVNLADNAFFQKQFVRHMTYR